MYGFAGSSSADLKTDVIEAVPAVVGVAGSQTVTAAASIVVDDLIVIAETCFSRGRPLDCTPAGRTVAGSWETWPIEVVVEVCDFGQDGFGSHYA